MKLPHVIVLSIIGMLVTSLSVLVFTARRQVPPQDALTPNEVEPVPNEAPVASIPKPNVSVEPPSSIALPASAPEPSPLDSMPPELRKLIGSGKAQPFLRLMSATELCDYYVDAKNVGFGGIVLLGAPIGRHVVQCHRPNGEVLIKSIDVVEGRINTVTF